MINNLYGLRRGIKSHCGFRIIRTFVRIPLFKGRRLRRRRVGRTDRDSSRLSLLSAHISFRFQCRAAVVKGSRNFPRRSTRPLHRNLTRVSPVSL